MMSVIPVRVIHAASAFLQVHRAIYRSVLLLALLGLAGCSTPGMKQLKAACEEDAGQTIYETVSADGYYDDSTSCYSCWIRLIYSDYQYREFQRRETDRSFYLLPEIGYWRLEKVKKDSGQCNQDIERDMDKLIGDKVVKKFREEQCIATRRVAEPSSEFGYFEEVKRWRLDNRDHSKMARFQETILRQETKDPVATFVQYHLVPWPNSALSYGKVVSCFSTGHVPIEKQPSLIKRVIKASHIE